MPTRCAAADVKRTPGRPLNARGPALALLLALVPFVTPAVPAPNGPTPRLKPPLAWQEGLSSLGFATIEELWAHGVKPGPEFVDSNVPAIGYLGFLTNGRLLVDWVDLSPENWSTTGYDGGDVEPRPIFVPFETRDFGFRMAAMAD